MTTTLERREDQDIDPRIAARRQQVERDRGRRRVRIVVIISAAVALLAGAWGLTRTSLLDVDRIDVRGAERIPTDDVVAASGVHAGEALLDVDAGAVRARLLGLPWVADAAVAVNWPDQVTITVTEREPVAALQADDGGWLLVDREGRVLGPATEAGWLPIEGLTAAPAGEQVGGPAGEALAVVDALTPGVRTRVAAVVMGGDGQVTLRLRPQGVAILGPPSDLEAKVLALRTLFAQVDDRDLASVDVRVPDRPVVVRATAAATSTGPAAGG